MINVNLYLMVLRIRIQIGPDPYTVCQGSLARFYITIPYKNEQDLLEIQ